MRSTHVFLFLILACWCGSVFSICSNIETIILKGIFHSDAELKQELLKYTSDDNAINAALKIKYHVLRFSLVEKYAIVTLMKKILEKKC